MEIKSRGGNKQSRAGGWKQLYRTFWGTGGKTRGAKVRDLWRDSKRKGRVVPAKKKQHPPLGIVGTGEKQRRKPVTLAKTKFRVENGGFQEK